MYSKSDSFCSGEIIRHFVVFIVRARVAVFSFLGFPVLPCLLFRSSYLSQTIHHTHDQSSTLANLHGSDSIESHSIALSGQHSYSFSHLRHAHLTEISYKPPYHIWLDKIVRRS